MLESAYTSRLRKTQCNSNSSRPAQGPHCVMFHVAEETNGVGCNQLKVDTGVPGSTQNHALQRQQYRPQHAHVLPKEEGPPGTRMGAADSYHGLGMYE